MYGHSTPGNSQTHDVVEVVVGTDSTVVEIRGDMPGYSPAVGEFVLSGRESAADWLSTNFLENGSILILPVPDWRDLKTAVSGGPRFVQNGSYYADPMHGKTSPCPIKRPTTIHDNPEAPLVQP